MDVKKRLLAGDIDAVTFTSSSTVDGFMRHFFNPGTHTAF